MPVHCPDSEVLRRFCVGQLAPRVLEVIADHVAGCPPCRGFVDDFPEDSDALLSYLRACADDRTNIDDPACRSLESRARAIRVTGASPGRPHAWATPLTVPGYEVGPEVGHGPHGTVYRARRLADGAAVALKRLFPGVRAEPARLAPYRDGHRRTPAGVVALIDVLSTGSDTVLVASWIEGSDLGRILAGRKAARRGRARGDSHPWAALDEAEYRERIRECFTQVLQAVAGLHQAGLVHGALRPTNILIDADDAAFVGDAWSGLLSASHAETVPGHPRPAYLSPEHWDGRDAVDARSDVFCLGVMLYEAVTLELPFGNRRVRATEAAPLAPRYWQPLLDAGTDELVLRAVQPQPRRRFANAGELAEQWQRRQRGPRATLGDSLRRLWKSLWSPA